MKFLSRWAGPWPAWVADYGKVVLALAVICLWDTLHGALGSRNAGNPFRQALHQGLGLMLPYALWMLLAPMCLWATHARRLDSRPFWKAAGLHLFAMAVYCSLFVFLFFGLDEFRHGHSSGQPWVSRFLGSFAHHRDWIGSWTGSGWINWFICTSFAHLVAFWRDMRDKELRASHLEARLAQSQLHSLKAQIQPHFLFNTLNSIYSLVPLEATEARRMLVLLSDFLRRALQESNLQMVSLRREMEFVDLYLEIQSLRFPNRLRVERDLAKGALDWMVPHLLLQPLVENAIKHGIGPKVEPGTLRIMARREQGGLRLTVADDGVGPSADTTGTGFGLSSTADRLRQLYGPKATLENGPGASGGFRVSLLIPAETAVLPSSSATGEP